MTPYVKWLDGFISQKVKEGYRYMWWVELRDHLSAICKEQAAAGYHVVQEGQAVVDGQVWQLTERDRSTSRCHAGHYETCLRPLTDQRDAS